MRRWPAAMALAVLFALTLCAPPRLVQAQASPSALYGYSGYATYYGIEDGVIAGDVMYDGTPYDPADPTIAAASFLIPMHTWLRVCQPARCIVVQVRDRGLLDQNSVLIDLSRAAYGMLFGQLGGKAWVSAYFSDPYSFGVDSAPVITSPLNFASGVAPAASSAPAQPAPNLPVPAGTPASPTAQPAPPPPNTIAVPAR